MWWPLGGDGTTQRRHFPKGWNALTHPPWSCAPTLLLHVTARALILIYFLLSAFPPFLSFFFFFHLHQPPLSGWTSATHPPPILGVRDLPQGHAMLSEHALKWDPSSRLLP
ncbi:hypothetical protein J3459_009854 [Metarhizium acridum]|nr:hypothetical protein J3459_009854 [Metarhizium acridum]